jgi:FkbM family methyltransferase
MSETANDRQFLTSLIEEVIADCFQVQTHNTDHLRFPQELPAGWRKVKSRVKEKIVTAAAARGFVYGNGTSPAAIAARMTRIVAAEQRFGEFYRLLGDETSRQLAVKLLAFGILGNERVRLPQNTPEYWRAVERIDKELLRQSGTIPLSDKGWQLDLYDLQPLGSTIKLNAHRLNILDTFLLEQYRYEKGGVRVAAEAGDFVVDAGGCWVDSALYFADRVGAEGRVFCFEFLPANLAIMARNLDLNPELRQRIEVVDRALWDQTGEKVAYADQGPGTALTPGGSSGGATAETITIDDFVAEHEVERIDLIKMDIEGAELAALRGAEKTLRRFRPKLAIAVYHNWDDFITIPPYLNGLGLGYEFYLDHFTIHEEETVLFCRPRTLEPSSPIKIDLISHPMIDSRLGTGTE